MSEINRKELGIYIHIPFCVSKCIYCDFLSAPMEDSVKEAYTKALIVEISDFAKKYSNEYCVKSVFFGGGTPSILDYHLTENILKCISDNFMLTKECEITMECNPGTISEDKIKAYVENGVNRISFGLQSVDNTELKKLGRIHTYEDFLASYDIARKNGINNINADIMSALPGQTIKSWERTLKEVIKLDLEHISAYSLIIEEGTRLADMVDKGIVNNFPNEEEERAIYYLTNDTLNKAGYKRYEISNHSKTGYECVHNKIYWQRGDYAGFGIGAASLIDEVRYTNISDIKKYIDNPLNAPDSREVIEKKDSMGEYMYLGLRMMDGVSINKFKRLYGCDISSVFGNVIDKYSQSGYMCIIDDNIKLTSKGIDVSNVIFSDLYDTVN